ncbi:MAG: hypothetical protein GY941_27470, partial [Planctomycetes bacterium]|nr:hypothetical protein [Planctomycetota bacterium]
LDIGTLVKVNGCFGAIYSACYEGGYDVYFTSGIKGIKNPIRFYFEDEISTDVSIVPNMSEVEIG